MTYLRAISYPSFEELLEASRNLPESVATMNVLAHRAIRALRTPTTRALNSGLGEYVLTSFLSHLEPAAASDIYTRDNANLWSALLVGVAIPDYQYRLPPTVDFRTFAGLASGNLVEVGAEDGGVSTWLEQYAPLFSQIFADPGWHEPCLPFTLGGECTLVLDKAQVRELLDRLSAREPGRPSAVERLLVLLQTVLAGEGLCLSCSDE